MDSPLHRVDSPLHSGFTPPQSGFTPPQSGFTPRQNGFTPPQSGFTPRQNGFTPPQSGFTPPQGGFTPPERSPAPVLQSVFSLSKKRRTERIRQERSGLVPAYCPPTLPGQHEPPDWVRLHPLLLKALHPRVLMCGLQYNAILRRHRGEELGWKAPPTPERPRPRLRGPLC
ncbi:unnamed protein product [Gadus morhua 'NCC']